MRKRIAIASASLLLLLVGTVAWEVWREREPVYQGKRLSVWLEGPPDADSISPETETAIRAMGTDALPALLNMVRIRNTLFRKVLSGLSGEQNWFRIHIRPVEEIHEMACCGFMVLGPAAKPAVPRLARLLEDKDPEVRCAAAACLGYLGQTSEDAVPELVAYLSQLLRTKTGSRWDQRGRYCAAFALCQIGPASRPAVPQLTALSRMTNTWNDASPALAQAALIKINGKSLLSLAEGLKDTTDQTKWFLEKGGVVLLYLGTNAEPVIPVLLTLLQQTNRAIQAQAIEVLGKIHAHPELCIRAIMPFLQSTNSGIRAESLDALRGFGSAAKNEAVLSEIRQRLNDPDASVRARATNTLRKIAPETATQAAVK